MGTASYLISRLTNLRVLKKASDQPTKRSANSIQSPGDCFAYVLEMVGLLQSGVASTLRAQDKQKDLNIRHVATAWAAHGRHLFNTEDLDSKRGASLAHVLNHLLKSNRYGKLAIY